MQEPRVGRLLCALLFALLAGAIAYWNPVARLESHLRTDVEQSVDTAASDLERAARHV